jgi:hypothetical protein
MDYWHKQDPNKPLFPDLIWSRPQHKRGAGKLLIIGGQAQDFSHVAAAFAAAEKAGAGVVRVIMPDSTKKFTSMLPNIEYAPSNTSGSFARAALSEFFAASEWADHVLLAGDFGKNSETTTVLDGYLLRSVTPLTIADNALHSIALPADQLLRRSITLVMSQKSLTKLAVALELTRAITSTLSPPQLAEIMKEITGGQSGSVVAQHNEIVWASVAGQVCSTTIKNPVDQSLLAASASIWVMQNPTKMFEALTTSITQI